MSDFIPKLNGINSDMQNLMRPNKNISDSNSATIVSDLENMLTLAHGYLEIIKTRPGSEDENENLVNLALQAINSAFSLNQSLISNYDDKTKEITLSNVVFNTASTLCSELIKWNYTETPFLYGLKIEKILLEKIIQNIISTAVHSMDGRGQLHVSACNIEKGNNISSALQPKKYVQICIRDNGVGLTEDEIAKVMVGFSDNKILNRQNIDLILAKEMVEASNGFMEIGSEEKFGNIFVIYLPA